VEEGISTVAFKYFQEEEQEEVPTTDPDITVMKKWPTLEIMKK